MLIAKIKSKQIRRLKLVRERESINKPAEAITVKHSGH